MSAELKGIIISGLAAALAFLGVAYEAGQLGNQVEVLTAAVTQMTEDDKDFLSRLSFLEGAAGDD